MPEVSLCRSAWKLLFLIQIQIYVDIIIIFSMENNSLLFASSYLSLCSQAWIDDFVICPSSSIGNLPPPKGAHKFHGKSVPTAWWACTQQLKPSTAKTNPLMFSHVWQHFSTRQKGTGSFCNTRQRSPHHRPLPQATAEWWWAVFFQIVKWRGPSVQHQLTNPGANQSKSLLLSLLQLSQWQLWEKKKRFKQLFGGDALIFSVLGEIPVSADNIQATEDKRVYPLHPKDQQST